jgi:hypothetical protein
MPVVGTGGSAGASGLALGWEWRLIWNGWAVPASFPSLRTRRKERSKGSYADLGVIPMFAFPGRRGLPEVGIMQRLLAPRCGEAVEEVKDGVAGLVASQLLFGGCGAVESPFFELQVGVKVLHRRGHVLVS